MMTTAMQSDKTVPITLEEPTSTLKTVDTSPTKMSLYHTTWHRIREDTFFTNNPDILSALKYLLYTLSFSEKVIH